MTAGERRRGHGDKLPRTQARAVTALLTAPTVEEAAEACGVSVATLRRWQALPEFHGALRDAGRRVVDSAIVRLQQAAGEAVETLRASMKPPTPAPQQVSAARAVLEHALRAVELLDLEDRVEALEQMLTSRNGSHNGGAR